MNDILEALKKAVDRYADLPLDDVLELSEILRELDVNLSKMVHIRDEHYKKFQSVYFNSQAGSDAAKKREAEFQVPELDLIRKILRHYSEMQSSIRSQISLRKRQDN